MDGKLEIYFVLRELRDLLDAGVNLIDDDQIKAVLEILPAGKLREQMKNLLNIKTGYIAYLSPEQIRTLYIYVNRYVFSIEEKTITQIERNIELYGRIK